MAVEATDSSIVNPPVVYSPALLRFRRAQLVLVVPRVDVNGERDVDTVNIPLDYLDPRLTDAQRTQFITTARFIARMAGVIV